MSIVMVMKSSDVMTGSEFGKLAAGLTLNRRELIESLNVSGHVIQRWINTDAIIPDDIADDIRELVRQDDKEKVDRAARLEMIKRLTREEGGRLIATTVEPPTAGEIRAMRKGLGMGLVEFTEFINCSQSYLTKIERGSMRPANMYAVLLRAIKTVVDRLGDDAARDS
jgi:DNA-binding transcriptional regulator YiaG